MGHAFIQAACPAWWQFAHLTFEGFSAFLHLCVMWSPVQKANFVML